MKGDIPNAGVLLSPKSEVSMNHMCPVCGYDGLKVAPEDFEICPCCGTEFGLDDIQHTVAELREHWMGRGAPWFSHTTLPQSGWNPLEQLANAKIK